MLTYLILFCFVGTGGRPQEERRNVATAGLEVPENAEGVLLVQYRSRASHTFFSFLSLSICSTTVSAAIASDTVAFDSHHIHLKPGA